MKTWISLLPYWAEIVELSNERLNQKKDFKSFRGWNNNPNLVGLAGEFIFSIATGLPVNKELLIAGDGGIDFIHPLGSIDVKTTTRLDDPWLLQTHTKDFSSKKWPDYFGLVVFNMELKKGYVSGVVDLGKMLRAPTKNFGYKDNFGLHERELDNWDVFKL